jgi:putative RNA 2'-phosphotransferase
MELFRNEEQKKRISKTMSYILRHNPEEFGIVLDPEGYTEISDLVNALHTRFDFVEESHVRSIVLTDEKQRYKIDCSRICANYGHSVKELTPKYTEVEPPDCLFHGTKKETYEKVINKEGIKKMNRLFVHLSTDEATAASVGQRHGKPHVITICAKDAWRDGVKFFLAENGTYLVDFIDPKYFKQ